MKPKYRVIGVSAQFGAGKDTFCKLASRILVSHGFVVQRLAFADLMKKEICEALGVPIGWIETNKSDPAVRQLMQLWGTDIRRKYFSDTYWIDPVVNTAFSFLGRFENAINIITDVRFLNESKILNARFKTLNVGILGPQRVKGVLSEHSSEAQVESIPKDVVIQNPKISLDDYEQTILEDVIKPFFL